MRMRTIFCPKGEFDTPDEFLSYLGKLISKGSGKFDASFYLFPEDIFGLYERLAGTGLTLHQGFGKRHVMTHVEIPSFIKRIQAVLGPKDFAVFSLYSSVGSIFLNSGFFVGKKQWFFDYKRTYSVGDMKVIGHEQMDMWRIQSKLMAKTPGCVKAGEACIKGIHLLVCADLALLPKMRLSKNFLCFIPALDLGELQLHKVLQQIRGSGRIFINDSFNGRAWAFSVSGKDKGIEKLSFEGKPICFEFEG